MARHTFKIVGLDVESSSQHVDPEGIPTTKKQSATAQIFKLSCAGLTIENGEIDISDLILAAKVDESAIDGDDLTLTFKLKRWL